MIGLYLFHMISYLGASAYPVTSSLVFFFLYPLFLTLSLSLSLSLSLPPGEFGSALRVSPGCRQLASRQTERQSGLGKWSEDLYLVFSILYCIFLLSLYDTKRQ